MPRKKTSETIPKNKTSETIPKNKTSETMPIRKASETMPRKKASDTLRIKPCETMRIKPCETIPKRSRKKRCVMPSEVEKVEEEEEEISVMKFEKGEHVDVKALLSTKDRNFLITTKAREIVPISSLEGKYVLVYCFIVPPDEHGPESSFYRIIEALYSELSLQGIADIVKFVLVPKFATPRLNDPNFDTFFDNLSLNCLAIPFSDSMSRDNVCESLGLCTSRFWATEICLVVHPSGMVLQTYPDVLERYGPQSFPFTDEHFDNIVEQNEILSLRFRSTDSPISLGELLQCDSLSQIGDENKSIPTSRLADTPVGLYLCFDGFDGGFMVDLQAIHQKCLDKGLKFEIVLVPLPFARHYDPQSFYELVKQFALKDSTSSSWWAFPFNNKICHTLWRLFHGENEDQLIILPHGGRLGDLWGRQIATFYGIDAYPFTRDVIVERKVNELRSFTLEQLLGATLMPHLRNKNVLLCFDYPKLSYEDGCVYKMLNEDYREIKVKYPDSEVVFVPFEPVSSAKNRHFSKKGWLILPPDLIESVTNHIFMEDSKPNAPVYPTLVTFGKDGKILSRLAEIRLPGMTSSASLFDDTLASEIIREMKEDMDM